MGREDINSIVARVILSTKRKTRQYSLTKIAADIRSLQELLGNLNEVSKVIGISSGMLNQFLSVFKLPKSTIKLVDERKIDSVSTVHYLSKFNSDDIDQLSKILVSNYLKSQDLRVLLPFRKQHPDQPITDLVEKLQLSKNVKVSVIRISKDDSLKSLSELSDLFSRQVGQENVLAIEPNGKFIDIKLSKQGEKILRKCAKSSKRSLQDLISNLIS